MKALGISNAKDDKTNWGGIVGAGANVVGMGISAMMAKQNAKDQDRRQIKQQGELNKLNTQQAKDLTDYNYQKQLQMWKDTNFGPQVEELKKAGLNPALMYGMGGGGGSTTGSGSGASAGGSQAANAASTQGASTDATTGMGLMLGQMKLMEAQAEKTKAETEKIKGVDTEEATQRTAGIKFQNELNNEIGLKQMEERYRWASDKLQIESEKANAEWEAFKAGGFAGKTYDDQNSPVAKAIKAGLDKTGVELENAKTEGNVKKAEQAIKEYEANLTKEGIPVNSPWGVKIMVDLLNKFGITTGGVVDTAEKGMKVIEREVTHGKGNYYDKYKK